MKEQKVLTVSEKYTEIDNYLLQQGAKKIFLVCGSSFRFLDLNTYFVDLEARLGIKVVRFGDFAPNPIYDSVVMGVEVFRKEKCDLVFAVGGGSAMDVAKCVKLFATMQDTVNYLEQEIVPNNIPLAVVPTTAGTGSEATRYAVIYYQGEKQSVTNESCIPGRVFFDTSVLKYLPEYQRKATMLDALCHALESFWSVNSTGESKTYAAEAIRMVLKSKDAYLANEPEGNEEMLRASYLAGKAINITQTTAGHAMSYKITTLYGIAHGHAAALCVSKLWPYMLNHQEQCSDGRGQNYLNEMFAELARVMGCEMAEDAVELFASILKELDMNVPRAKETDFEILSQSVNVERLKNNPVSLDKDDINELYRVILR